MNGENKHEHFCFAGQPAPCRGYFPNDVLPCVCGARGSAVTALSQVAVPVPPLSLLPRLAAFEGRVPRASVRPPE
jgi:hypothetical protein